MKLRITLENFKGVFAHVWFNKAMTIDQLSFDSVEIDKSYSLTLPPWKNLCHRWSRDQPQPGSFFQRPREEKKRESLGTRLTKQLKGLPTVVSILKKLC